MLTDLSIRNFAIIDELKISFPEGLTILSGETGAGKSIIIGAISLLLGERATADLIRSSEDAATVEASFDIHDRKDIKARLEEMGFPAEDELIVKRIVSRSGRNRIYVNGNMATLASLSALSESLVNICGQHEHQVLLSADSHIDILDEFGGLLPSRSEYTRLFEDYQDLRARLEELRSIQKRRAEREDFMRFQMREIDSAGVKAGEDETLSDEKRILAHAGRLLEIAGASHEAIYGREGSLLAELGRIINQVREIRRIDPEFRVSPEELDSVIIQLEDTALALRDYMKKLPQDPARLNEVEERLELLSKLKRKYGGSLESVLRTWEGVEEELRGLETVSDDIERITEQISVREAQLRELAAILSRERVKTASLLEKAINGEIRSLRMEQAKFKVMIGKPSVGGDAGDALHAKGVDTLEFYLSTNVGEELKPLNRIASGGELSRIVLAMKKVLARTGSVGTVIFDEVDSGIGGAAAEVVGRKLKDVSEHHQVICITHLPQIACFGDGHYLVAKGVSGARTKASVQMLNDKERLDEIARMLGGVKVTDKTREHAKEMLKAARG
jgi:DNA repair protein RecN (Recombination protein N)